MPEFTIVQPHLEFGGAERQTVILANRLVAKGHVCNLILHARKGGLVADLDPRVVTWDLGLENHLGVAVTAWKLHKILRRINPSFVIVKLWSSILAAALVDRFNPQHVFNYCEDLDPADHATFIRFGRWKQRLIGHIFRRRRYITANTHAVAESMNRKYNLRRMPDVISSVIDHEEAQTRARAADAARLPERPTGVFRICSVGSLIPRKGLTTTWQALQMLPPGRIVEWHIVGTGPMHDHLRALTPSREGLSLILHGGMANPYRIMSECDVTVHGAVSEAFGIVLLESLAVGTPVIAADAIGPAEIRANLTVPSDAFDLFKISDVDQLRSKLLVERPKLDQASGAHMVGPYTLEATTEKWINRANALMPR